MNIFQNIATVKNRLKLIIQDCNRCVALICCASALVMRLSRLVLVVILTSLVDQQCQQDCQGKELQGQEDSEGDVELCNLGLNPV